MDRSDFKLHTYVKFPDFLAAITGEPRRISTQIVARKLHRRNDQSGEILRFDRRSKGKQSA
ncbi:MAG: hypothetical protein EBS23_04155 [Betaproteobacteria bacterium]|nr:hypothetical protein [Betaproteobacteria bacterium]